MSGALDTVCANSPGPTNGYIFKRFCELVVEQFAWDPRLGGSVYTREIGTASKSEHLVPQRAHLPAHHPPSS